MAKKSVIQYIHCAELYAEGERLQICMVLVLSWTDTESQNGMVDGFTCYYSEGKSAQAQKTFNISTKHSIRKAQVVHCLVSVSDRLTQFFPHPLSTDSQLACAMEGFTFHKSACMLSIHGISISPNFVENVQNSGRNAIFSQKKSKRQSLL